MPEYDLKVSWQLLSNLLSEKNGLAEPVEAILNQIMEVQASAQKGWARSEICSEIAESDKIYLKTHHDTLLW